MNTDTEYITVTEAAQRHGKCTETIRRWAGLAYPPVRTHITRNVRYVHAGDIAASAAAHPPPRSREAQVECGREGHLPDAAAAALAGVAGPGEWITVAEAARRTLRSKSSLRLWIKRGEIAAASCPCQWRRFVWEPSLFEANSNHTYQEGPTDAL